MSHQPSVANLARMNKPATLLICWLSIATAHAGTQRIYGFVCEVHDGDTFQLTNAAGDCSGQDLRLRAADAPELKGRTWSQQPFGIEARGAFVALTQDKLLSCRVYADASYDRTVVRCTLPDGTDVNTAMIRQGYAWVDPRYATQADTAAQLEAMAAGRGLWAAPMPTAPWVWREPLRDRCS